ncbi:hypothetical protein BJ742DRAFT_878907 [Cladochytrium replicatum]|nr:hypothetical protein BJ742DRAFT_878907 [Cladochytrium replicatum]
MALHGTLSECVASQELYCHRRIGVWLFDESGRNFLDLNAGIAANALGHADPDGFKAISQQAAKIVHLSNLYRHEPAGELAEMQQFEDIQPLEGIPAVSEQKSAQKSPNTLQIPRKSSDPGEPPSPPPSIGQSQICKTHPATSTLANGLHATRAFCVAFSSKSGEHRSDALFFHQEHSPTNADCCESSAAEKDTVQC